MHDPPLFLCDALRFIAPVESHDPLPLLTIIVIASAWLGVAWRAG